MGIMDVKIDGGLIKDTLTGIGGLFRDIRTAITGKLDPEKEAEFFQKMAEMEAAANNAQVEVNKVEAASQSVFVAGWRPFIGWVCGGSLACYYIPQALMASILWSVQCVMVMWQATNIAAVSLPHFPLTFNLEEIIGLVMSLLGLGGLKTAERIKGVIR